MSDVLLPWGSRLTRAKEMIVRSRALIFDVDGTLAETEEVHRNAFNAAFVRASSVGAGATPLLTAALTRGQRLAIATMMPSSGSR